MALRTVKGSHNIPSGAVHLTKEEAITHQKNIIRDWNNASEVVFLRYGGLIASVFAFASSVFVTKHFRTQFKLDKQARFLTYCATTFMPTLLSGIYYERKVTSDVILMKISCPMCLQLSSSFFQVNSSIIYPGALAILVCSSAAKMSNTVQMPSLSKEPIKVYKLYYKFIKSGALKFQVLGALHLLTGFALPYLQNKEIIKITNTLSVQYSELEDLE